jgi:hypothetical protein
MATTTNYGWTTPDDTALVKDGAAAIRTLGSSVDTTTKNLNPSTTLGDIEYRSSTANVNTRLPLGTANQLLRVNAGATAPEWHTPAAAGGMTLINSGGTTLTGASVTISSIPATYKNLQLVIRNFKPVSDDNALAIRFNSDSATRYYGTASVSTSSQSFDGDELFATVGTDNGTAQGLSIVTIYDYANTDTWKLAITDSLQNNSTTATNFNYRRYYGVYNQIAAISSITLRTAFGGGNMTSGTAFLYGVS